MMQREKKKRVFQAIVSVVFAVILTFSAISEAFQVKTEASGTDIYCNVRFSKPAICCDVNDVIDLTKCAVQFSPNATMTNGITWSHNGATVKSFTPTERGVFALTAKAGASSPRAI